MAKPIKETPILSGKDAQKFLKNLRAPKKVSSKTKETIKRDFDLINSIAKF